METQNNTIKKETVRSLVTLDSLISGEFQKTGTVTAMLRQEVKTKSFYPSALHSSDMQENIFSA